MDDAADRIDLRGLGLLARARGLRRDESRQGVGRAQARLSAAEVGVRDGEHRLQAHRAAWQTFDSSSLDAMRTQPVAGERFRDRRTTLERLADQAIRLQAQLEDARLAASEARAALDAAKCELADRQKRLEQTEAVASRVTTRRADAASAAADQELDDEIAQRFGRRARRG